MLLNSQNSAEGCQTAKVTRDIDVGILVSRPNHVKSPKPCQTKTWSHHLHHTSRSMALFLSSQR